MGRIRRYGFIFNWQLGDHEPIHIHVYKDDKLICKWILKEERVLSGKADRKIRKAIKELRLEGKFKKLESRQ